MALWVVSLTRSAASESLPSPEMSTAWITASARRNSSTISAIAVCKHCIAVEIVRVDHPILSPLDVAAVLLEGRIVGIGRPPQEVSAIETFGEVNDMLAALTLSSSLARDSIEVAQEATRPAS